jgi:proline iminopeptidase
MKIILLFILSAISLQIVKSQDLYVKAFGKSENKNKTILYLHGGPGYNCVNFEISTAQKLADEGYYVICYDRRGEGRSIGSAKFAFEEAIQDINLILEKEKIDRVTLFGHSFGGMLGVKYAEKHPSKVSNLVLIGAPINLQESFKHIISTVKNIYTTNNDRTNLKYIDMLEKMDTTKMEYASYCFMHAMQNKFYTPKKPTVEAGLMYQKLFADSSMKKYAAK